MNEQRVIIVCWKDHRIGLDIKNFHDLAIAIHSGFLWHKEDEEHDEKVTITIEVEDDFIITVDRSRHGWQGNL